MPHDRILDANENLEAKVRKANFLNITSILFEL
jgi:hypothetical protein